MFRRGPQVHRPRMRSPREVFGAGWATYRPVFGGRRVPLACCVRGCRKALAGSRWSPIRCDCQREARLCPRPYDLAGSAIRHSRVLHRRARNGRAQGDLDAFAAHDHAIGWAKLLRAWPEVTAIAEPAGEDSLVRAADRWVTVHKFAPALLEAINFKAARGLVATLAAIETRRDPNRLGIRDAPEIAPCRPATSGAPRYPAADWACDCNRSSGSVRGCSVIVDMNSQLRERAPAVLEA